MSCVFSFIAVAFVQQKVEVRDNCGSSLELYKSETLVGNGSDASRETKQIGPELCSDSIHVSALSSKYP